MTVTPVFPGGFDTAPEIMPGGACGHAACFCTVEPGHRYCCRACARASEDQAVCPCGHAGCADRSY